MTGAGWAVLALAIVVIVGAGAVAANPAAFFYGLARLAWADLLPKLVPLIVKAISASPQTVERVRDDTRRRVDCDVRGKERNR